MRMKGLLSAMTVMCFRYQCILEVIRPHGKNLLLSAGIGGVRCPPAGRPLLLL